MSITKKLPDNLLDNIKTDDNKQISEINAYSDGNNIKESKACKEIIVCKESKEIKDGKENKYCKEIIDNKENKENKEVKESIQCKVEENSHPLFGSLFQEMETFKDIKCSDDMYTKSNECGTSKIIVADKTTIEKTSSNTSVYSYKSDDTSSIHQQVDLKKPKLSESLQSLLDRRKENGKQDKLFNGNTPRTGQPLQTPNLQHRQTIPIPCSMDRGEVDSEVNELCGYFENNLNIPKKMSAMAESMYA